MLRLGKVIDRLKFLKLPLEQRNPLTKKTGLNILGTYKECI